LLGREEAYNLFYLMLNLLEFAGIRKIVLSTNLAVKIQFSVRRDEAKLYQNTLCLARHFSLRLSPHPCIHDCYYKYPIDSFFSIAHLQGLSQYEEFFSDKESMLSWKVTTLLSLRFGKTA
jgi:hypothetical protein